jgi:hypothetical protein
MPLDAETIARLTQPKPKRAPAISKGGTGGKPFNKLIRRQVQYPKLVPNEFVEKIPEKSGTHACTSFGCGCPSYYTFRGEPMCSIHLIWGLVYELNRVSNSATTNGSEEQNGDSYL